MTLNLEIPDETILKPKIIVFGVGGAGGNATNNMIRANLEGVNFVVANTDSQALENSQAQKRIQLGKDATKGLGAGAKPEVGKNAAEEAIDEIKEYLQGSNMVFITAGMGGGTGTGAAPVIAKAAKEEGILTVGVVTKPFHFEGPRRMKIAQEGISRLQEYVDTLIIIPNQNLFRVANEKTTFADAFKMADEVLHSGVRGITDLMIMPGLINLDFADVRAVMCEMGKAMMGTGEATGENRAISAAEAAISNPLLDNVSMRGARGVLINITGGFDMTLFEVDEAANRIREEVDETANIIFGSTFDESLEGILRISVVATGIDAESLISTKKAADASDIDSDILSASDDMVDNAIEEVSGEIFKEMEEDLKSQLSTGKEEKEYYDAVKNINEEFKEEIENLRSQNEQDSQEDLTIDKEGGIISSDDENFEDAFMVAQPKNPTKFTQDPLSSGGTVKKSKKGLFSKMVNAAKNLGGNNKDENIWQDELNNNLVDEEEENSKIDETAQENNSADGNKKEEDILEIPAFLRRKA